MIFLNLNSLFTHLKYYMVAVHHSLGIPGLMPSSETAEEERLKLQYSTLLITSPDCG